MNEHTLFMFATTDRYFYSGNFMLEAFYDLNADLNSECVTEMIDCGVVLQLELIDEEILIVNVFFLRLPGDWVDSKADDVSDVDLKLHERFHLRHFSLITR